MVIILSETVKVRRIGNSVGISFSSEVRQLFGIKEGQEFKAVQDDNGSIILVPKIKSIYDESKYAPGSLYQKSQVSKDDPQGREDI